MVLFLRAKKANAPTLGPRFLVKFPRVGKAIEVKCPTYARGYPTLGLNIDRCIILCRRPSEKWDLTDSKNYLISLLTSLDVFHPITGKIVNDDYSLHSYTAKLFVR